MNAFPADRLNFLKKSVIREIFDNAPEKAINLGLGEIQFSTPSNIVEYAKQILQDRKIHYTPNAGLKELREKVSEYYLNKVPYENICITVGAEEAIFATILAYVNPGDEVLLANPCYLAYETIVKIAGGKPVYFNLDPCDDFSLDKISFMKKISSKTKLLILNNPSNPLGICFYTEEINYLIKICKQNNILIIVDEVYRELYLQEKPVSFVDMEENALIISGLSKSHCMTGWRLGWVVSRNRELIDPIISLHQYICTCAPYISQKVAVYALSHEGMNSKDEIRLILKDNCDYLKKEIIKHSHFIKFLENSSSPYLFVQYDMDDAKLTRILSENGVLVIPGSAFGSKGKKWIRINYGLDKEILKEGIKRISAALRK